MSRALSPSLRSVPTALERFVQLLVEAERVALDGDDLPAALGEVERIKATLTIRLFRLTPPTPSSQDRLLGVKEAAELLGISPSTLYREAPQYPFTVRQGTRLRFSLTGLQTFLARRRGST